ncbi:hypothetical protein PGTUg99_030123 [Puccinia graminis f. sp. tritici]|uniref:Uncharacterized protein n=1 Tax=Puccinia graminis f. sp. tritici TaxID=56615 RepID=A0A5B0RU80_PUCGR|nr:hypothetical protein PGTUg99_030123 [Puccinia graminis f. sp. tritici]
MGRQFKQNPLLLRDPVFARSSCLIATFLRLRNESEDHLFTKIVASFSSLPSLQKDCDADLEGIDLISCLPGSIATREVTVQGALSKCPFKNCGIDYHESIKTYCENCTAREIEDRLGCNQHHFILKMNQI